VSEKTRRESVAQARAARLAEAVVEATAGRPGVSMPSAERVMAELATAKSVNDFYGKDGIFARLFAKTIEEMLEGELTAHLGYEAHEVVGRNSGNSRNGRYRRTLKTEGGEQTIAMPRDRNGSFEPQIIGPYQRQTNEIEEKILALYARGQSVRDIQDVLEELYGIDVAPTTISAVTDKIMPLVSAWQTRPLAAVYPIVFLDGLHIKLRRENNRVETVVVYIVFAIDTEGHRDVLGHWVSDGAEGANFWLSVITDLQSRGVEDILIACVDGLAGFDEAIRAVFPKVRLQRCVIHQIRASLRYVTWKDYKAFIADLKTVYRAPTRDEAERQLLRLEEVWGKRYPAAVRSWLTNWEDLATFFDFPAEIRRLIYTTNRIEAYNRQLRKVIKTKGSFPTPDAARKLLYLAHMNISKRWTGAIQGWPLVLNQLAIRFDDRLPL